MFIATMLPRQDVAVRCRARAQQRAARRRASVRRVVVLCRQRCRAKQRAASLHGARGAQARRTPRVLSPDSRASRCCRCVVYVVAARATPGRVAAPRHDTPLFCCYVHTRSARAVIARSAMARWHVATRAHYARRYARLSALYALHARDGSARCVRHDARRCAMLFRPNICRPESAARRLCCVSAALSTIGDGHSRRRCAFRI